MYLVVISTCCYRGVFLVVRLLVATLHVGMTRFQDGGYTQFAQLQNIIH